MANVELDMKSILLKSLKASIPEVEGILTEVMEEGAEKYIEILKALVPDSLQATVEQFTPSEPNVTKFTSHATGWYKRGRVDISVDIPEDALRRDSLNSKRDGAYDILGLFDQGYSIESKYLPWGEWNGMSIFAKRSRPGLYFFDQASAQAYAEIEGLAKIERN